MWRRKGEFAVLHWKSKITCLAVNGLVLAAALGGFIGDMLPCGFSWS